MPSKLEMSTTLDAELTAVIRRVGAEVLETMFFAEAVPADCQHSGVPGMAVRVAFEGSHLGEFRLCISTDAVDEIASAFLGLSPEEIEEFQRGHVMLELANILCGAVLSSLWPESSLTLRAPEQADPSEHLDGAAHQCFTMPAGMLGISIRLGAGSEV